MVFQAAQSALNPVMTVEEQFVETLLAHGEVRDKQKQRERCKELLSYVKLTPTAFYLPIRTNCLAV